MNVLNFSQCYFLLLKHSINSLSPPCPTILICLQQARYNERVLIVSLSVVGNYPRSSIFIVKLEKPIYINCSIAPYINIMLIMLMKYYFQHLEQPLYNSVFSNEERCSCESKLWWTTLKKTLMCVKQLKAITVALDTQAIIHLDYKAIILSKKREK